MPQNINDTELGNLGLTDDEENAIVAFMKTLSDGYKLPKSSDEIDTDFQQGVVIGPNPANEQTRITYTLQQANRVEIVLYSLNGTKTDTLRDDWQGMGKHELWYDTSLLPSGIYIIGIRTGQMLHVQKISIVH